MSRKDNHTSFSFVDKLEVDKNLEEILDFSSEDTENENDENNFIKLNTGQSNEGRNIKQNNLIGIFLFNVILLL